MGAGSFEVGLLTYGSGLAVPPSIWSDLEPWDHLCVGPRDLLDTVSSDSDRLALLKASGGYTGVITRIDDGGSLAGHDLSWWLGDADGRGPRFGPFTEFWPVTPTTWLDKFLPINDISRGTVTGGSSFAGVSSPASLGIDLLNWVAEGSGSEWLMHPDCTVDLGASTSLFPAPTATSGVIITRRPASREGGLSGASAVAMTRVRDASTTISEAWVVYAATTSSVTFATSSQTPLGVRFKGPKGGTPVRGEFFDQVGEDLTLSTTLADTAIARRSLVPIDVTLSSLTHSTSDVLTPGARVWVFDREMGIFDTANTVVWGGEVIQPLVARVTALTQPITEHDGVFLRVDGGARWHDISSYVLPEEPVTQWEITTGGVRANQSPIRSTRSRAIDVKP